jgi:hypothetical protein
MFRITALFGEFFSLSLLARSKETTTDNLTMRFFAAVKIHFRILDVTAVAGAHSANCSKFSGDFFRV